MTETTTWEQRMAARAAERAAVQKFVKAVDEWESDPHRDHHPHLSGTEVFCSCGEYRGITCVVIDDDYDPAAFSCEVCGAQGVSYIGR